MTHKKQGTGSWKKNRDKHEGASKPVKDQKKTKNGRYHPEWNGKRR